MPNCEKWTHTKICNQCVPKRDVAKTRVEKKRLASNCKELGKYWNAKYCKCENKEKHENKLRMQNEDSAA